MQVFAFLKLALNLRCTTWEYSRRMQSIHKAISACVFPNRVQNNPRLVTCYCVLWYTCTRVGDFGAENTSKFSA